MSIPFTYFNRERLVSLRSKLGLHFGTAQVDILLYTIDDLAGIMLGAEAGEPVPGNITVPMITGSAVVGQTLTASPGTWRGTPILTYQWNSAGAPISGATTSSLLLTEAEEGQVITVVVSANYGTGPVLTTASSATTEVEADPLAGIFVDSVNGNNANNGTSLASAKQTIAAAMPLVEEGDTLFLVRGSYWREQISPVDDMNVRVVGTGVMPTLDAADVATGWTAVGDLTNVWELTWARPGPITGNDWLGVWVNGIRARRAVTNSDLRDGPAGGYFVDGGNFFANPAVVRIQSATDPNSNGNVYEITRRNSGIMWHSAVGGTGVEVNVEGPIEVKRASNHYNAVASGPGVVENMLLRDGHIHHMVTDGSLTRNVIATEIMSNLAIPGVPFTAYRADGTNFSHTFEKCMALFSGGANRTEASTGFYAHSSTVIDGPFIVTKSAVRGMDGMACASQVYEVSDSYVEDCHAYAVDLTGVDTAVERVMSHHTAQTPRIAGAHFARNSNPNGNHVISHCTNYGWGTVIENEDGGGGSGSISLDHCSLVSRGGNGFNAGIGAVNFCVIEVTGRVLNGLQPGFSGDHNVFFSFAENPDNPWIHYNGTLYSYEPLAPFTAASGSNANSVYTRHADQSAGNPLAFWLGVANNTGGPAVGDFRINPNARVYGHDNNPRPSLTFMDNTSILLAGPQSHYDFATDSVVAGPPTGLPTLPTTIADMRTVIEANAAL